MPFTLHRREFLARSGQAAAAVVACGWPAASRAAEDQPALCLACRDSHLRETGRPDCWAALESIGAEGVEATVADDLALPGLFRPAPRRYTLADEAAMDALRADMRAAGKRISALCMHNRFEERPEMEIAWCTKAARAARAVGAAAIRIDVVPHKMSQAAFLEFSGRTLAKVIEATEATGVAFAIENHGGTTNNPEFLKPLLDRVGSPRLGITLDTGNFYWFGHPLSKVYELYEMFAPRVRHTHCKSIGYPADQREKRRPIGWQYDKYTCPIDRGDIDFHRVVKILRAAGYKNDLCIEDESLGHFPAAERGAILAREIRHLRTCM